MLKQNKFRYTTTDLTAIFHVGRTALHNHLKHNGLNKKLERAGHIKHTQYRIFYDDTALLKIARTFTLRGLSHVSKKPSGSNNSKNVRDIKRELKSINRKTDLIMNKLGINY